MTRKLKALGLALFATFAMSAVAAASASAVVQHHITSDSSSGVTHLTAESIGKQVFYATTGEELRVECSEIDLSTGTSTFEGSETTEVTVEPTYNKQQQTCTTSLGTVARVTTNGCHYTFTGETTTDVTENQSATVHLTCPENSTGIVVEVTVFDLPCIDVPEQKQALHGVTYEAKEGHIVLDAKVHGIESETTGPCGEGIHDDGLYEGKATVTGYSDTEHTTEVNLGLNTTEE